MMCARSSVAHWPIDHHLEFSMKKTYLTRYLVEQERNHGHVPPGLRLLLEVVARACKRISLASTRGHWAM
jgi:hypothetical protein